MPNRHKRQGYSMDTLESIPDNADDPTMTKESLVNNRGVCGCPVMGGQQPRFKTESQRKLWLRLRAKQDAKTEN